LRSGGSPAYSNSEASRPAVEPLPPFPLREQAPPAWGGLQHDQNIMQRLPRHIAHCPGGLLQVIFYTIFFRSHEGLDKTPFSHSSRALTTGSSMDGLSYHFKQFPEMP
jgi:hypothetical protein